MGCLLRFLAALAVLLVLAVAIRRFTERETPPRGPGAGEADALVDGVRWRSREAPGSGTETVVFIHGFLSSSATWKRVLATSSVGRRAVAVDLPGAGFSDRPWPYDYTAGAQALHLWKYLDARGIGRVVLVGNSLGGAVAMIAAAIQPQRVAALVLVDSAFPQVDVPWPFRTLRAPVSGEIEMELLSRPVMAIALRQRLYARSDRVTPEVVADWWDPVGVPGTRRAALAAVRSSPRGLESLTDRITMPTLVIWGAEDRLLPPSEGLRLSEAIRGARFETIPDSGHLPQEERPGDFAKAVASFLGPSRPPDP